MVDPPVRFDGALGRRGRAVSGEHRGGAPTAERLQVGVLAALEPEAVRHRVPIQVREHTGRRPRPRRGP